MSDLRVVTSAESAARDTAAINAGIPSRALMERAGAAAAGEITTRYPDLLDSGVAVYAGPGNNGGDAWVVARALAAAGARVQVCEVAEPKTADARAERELALSAVSLGSPRSERLMIDGLLGTGSTGEPRGAIGEAVREIAAARERGAVIVALDVPTGVDATTGDATLAVTAHLTITFGTVKRGHLVARSHCGEIVVADIGLGQFAELDDGAPVLADERWIAHVVPPIPAESHKGTRKKLVILGGAEGMAGAAVLAARAAMRSGIGMVRVVVQQPSLAAVQAAEPFALAGAWPSADDDEALHRDILNWADAIVMGPGLGRSRDAVQLVERVLMHWRGPVLLDADALNAFAGRSDDLASLIGSRAALLTPHPAEFGRLVGCKVEDVLAQRFDIGMPLAQRVGATVLLKGVPTTISAPDGRRMVSATGTPVLAAAGSGDILSGIAGTLLAQTGDALVAGAAGAWVHGRAGELATGEAGGGWREAYPDADLDESLDDLEEDVDRENAGAASRVPPTASRGVTLDDVLAALPHAWGVYPRVYRYPVLSQLPLVGDAP